MTLRLKTFFTGLIALLTAALLACAPAGAKTASGGYQLFEPVTLADQHAIQLASLENFDYHAKIAPECCKATKGGVDPRDVGGIKGVRTHQDGPAAGGRKPQYHADGGLDRAKADFESAVGGQYTTLPNGNLRGTGPNGENIIFNPQSSGGLNPNVTGPPTIYVDGAAIRYD
ncbi:hypothetical protein [Palleronia caenipelagi]|uniref:hypothetical protein n=1 Tax=Palleronia caenipelagi TaxID=2489174 RepID=UPI001FEA2A9C|nr:hypothetical protein [Palleronia caenipelagi]